MTSGTTRPRAWWTQAWLHAVEEQPGADELRFQRGREYLARDMVRELRVRPGSFAADVAGSRGSPYVVHVRVRTYPPALWSGALDDATAGSAASVDGEMTPEFVAALAAAGVDVLPHPRDLAPECSCPDLADWCKHVVAACYLLAEGIDADPMLLFVLRGADVEHPVLAAIRDGRGAAAPEGTVSAAEAFARPRGALPELPRPPRRPGRPALLSGEPPRGTVQPAELQALAADAAVRAWQLLTDAGDGGLGLTQEQDVVRRAADLVGTRALDALARRAGLPAPMLTRRAVAWRYGGAGALAVLDEEWTPDYLDLAEGIAALGGNAHVSRNRVSDAADRRQLRLGTDRLWYPFRRVAKAWEMTGPPAVDPRALDI